MPDRVQEDTAKARTLITGALLAELGHRLYEYENTITWNTDCIRCATVLDSAYAETIRREQAEGKLAAIKDACRSIPTPIAERILAIIGSAEGADRG